MRALVRLLKQTLPEAISIAHFHDSRGTGIADCGAALEEGLTHFDTALGVTGGHPAGIAHGEGFAGNVCTEDLVTAFGAMGVATLLDLNKRRAAGLAAESMPGQTPQSKALRVGQAAGA